jgi:hypothetical protein
MKMPSSSARDRQVQNWLSKIEYGEIKLPRFQRHQAWDRKRICSLLDTVTKNLPIGITLLLEVGDQEKFASRELTTAPKTDAKVTEHLLDGQQRLTALWRGLYNNYDDFTFFLYLDKYNTNKEIEKEKKNELVEHINRKNVGTQRMPLWADIPKDCLDRGYIPINLCRPDNKKEIKTWVNDAFSSSKPDKKEESYDLLEEWMEKKIELISIIEEFQNTITGFNLPFLALPPQTPNKTALDIFINMNTNSKPLSQYDIIRAELEDLDPPVSLDDYQNKLNEEYPNVMHYFELPSLILTTSALMQDKSPNQKGIWDMCKDTMIDNWEKMANSLSKMATFMESQGIYDKNRLPTNAVLSVIAALYALYALDAFSSSEPDEKGKFETLFKKYLWSSFFTDRYVNSAASRAFSDFTSLKHILNRDLKEDGRKWNEDDVTVLNRIEFPLSTEDELRRVRWPKQENIRGRGILAVFSKLGAFDFADGSQLSRGQLIAGERQYHHVFPDALLKEFEIESYLTLNCALITDKTNLNISNKDPFTYLKDRYKWVSEDIVNTRLKSHLIPIEELKSGGYEDLTKDEKKAKVTIDFKKFIEKRAKYIAKAVEILTDGLEINAKEIINEVDMVSSAPTKAYIEA